MRIRYTLTGLGELAADRFVFDLVVGDEHDCFAQDEGQDCVAFEGERELGGFVAGALDDAEVAVCIVDHTVAAAEVDAVFVQLSFDVEEVAFDAAVVGYGQLGE